MTSGLEPVATLDVALAHAERLLADQPALAGEQAREILQAAPRHPTATLILAASLRRMHRPAEAIDLLRPLVASQPRWALAQRELGLALGDAGHGEEAVSALRVALKLQPALADAWRALGDHLTAIGDTTGADAAYAQHVRHSTRDPRLMEPALALAEGRIAAAEPLLRNHLKRFPTDVAAIRMLAEVAARIGRYGDAENLLARCLELAPGFTPRGTTMPSCCTGTIGRRRRSGRSSGCSHPTDPAPRLSQPQGGRARAARGARAGHRAL
jgi:predicted Zn-dependent protease